MTTDVHVHIELTAYGAGESFPGGAKLLRQKRHERIYQVPYHESVHRTETRHLPSKLMCLCETSDLLLKKKSLYHYITILKLTFCPVQSAAAQ